MKSNIKKIRTCIIGLALIGILMVSSGCELAGRTLFVATSCGPNTAFKIGKEKCNDKEVRVYLTSLADYYGQIGKSNLWDGTLDVEMGAMENGIKQDVLALLSRVYALNIYAKDNQIGLSEQQKEQVQKAATTYVENLSKEDADKLGVSVADILEMYERYGVALLVYKNLIEEIDEEVSEDEARILDAYVLEIEDPEVVAQVGSRVKDKDSFPLLVQTYSKGDKGILHVSRDQYPSAVEQIAFAMESDTIEGPIVAENKTYYVYCVDKYNMELSSENKENIINLRRQKILGDIEADQNQTYYSQINESYWEKLPIQGDGQNRSKLFFQVFDEIVEMP